MATGWFLSRLDWRQRERSSARGRRSEVHRTNFAKREKVVYRIHMKRVINRKLVMGMADGEVEVDGRVIYTATDLKVGLFQDTSAF